MASTVQEKFLQSMYLVKDLYLENVKNSKNSIKEDNLFFLMGKRFEQSLLQIYPEDI